MLSIRFSRHLLCLPMLLILSLATACAPICQLALRPKATTQKPASIEVETWAQLLLRGTCHDCSHTPLWRDLAPLQAAAAAPLGKSPRSSADKLAPKRLAEMKVVVQPLKDDASRSLVWLMTHQLGDDLIGPVALVSQGEARLQVHAIGSLKLPRGEVSLRLVPIGDGVTALDASSTWCEHVSAVSKVMCAESMRIMPLVDQHFLGDAMSPTIDLQHYQLKPVKGGLRPMLMQTIDIAFTNHQIVLTQHVWQDDYSVRRPSLPPRRSRQSEGVRRLIWTSKGWQAKEPPLWQTFAR